MREVNIEDQEQKYSALRQGEKEYISTFKLRFDNQLKAMEGARIADVTESKRALEFISKLDARRYGRMLSQMRNDALPRRLSTDTSIRLPHRVRMDQQS